MLEEAISKIESLAVTADRPHVIDQLSDKTRTALYVNGDVRFLAKNPPPRSHSVTALGSLYQALLLFGSDLSSVWLGMTRIVALLDHQINSHRDDTVQMVVVPHVAFALLRKAEWLSQQAMLTLLRHSLCDCAIDPAAMMDSIRCLKFAVKSEQTGKFTNTSAAMGRSVEAAVTGEINLPETVGFSFHPFPGLSGEVDVNVSVLCTLFTDPEAGLLKIEPQPGQIEEAERAALVALQKAIVANTDVSVLLGSP